MISTNVYIEYDNDNNKTFTDKDETTWQLAMMLLKAIRYILGPKFLNSWWYIMCAKTD